MLTAFERLFFALFGLTRPEDLKMTDHIGNWTLEMFKVVFSAYLLVTVIVLINLLIAMMSDTYQRIQVLIQKSLTEHFTNFEHLTQLFNKKKIEKYI